MKIRGFLAWLEETNRPHVSDPDRTIAVRTLRELADAIDKREPVQVADGWVEIALLCAAEDFIQRGGLSK